MSSPTNLPSENAPVSSRVPVAVEETGAPSRPGLDDSTVCWPDGRIEHHPKNDVDDNIALVRDALAAWEKWLS